MNGCAVENNAAAGKAGAVEAVTAALKLHATNAAVAEQASEAICTLNANGLCRLLQFYLPAVENNEFAVETVVVVTPPVQPLPTEPNSTSPSLSPLDQRMQAVCLITDVIGDDNIEHSTGCLVEWPPRSKQLCVLTNNHVLPSADVADTVEVMFREENASLNVA